MRVNMGERLRTVEQILQSLPIERLGTKLATLEKQIIGSGDVIGISENMRGLQQEIHKLRQEFKIMFLLFAAIAAPSAYNQIIGILL